jgi:hypothetical protein
MDVMINKFVLTFDVDWAPDFVINEVASVLITKKIKATWFITHSSPALDMLRKHEELFELGIHPNFLPRSSHGGTPEEVLRHMLRIVPEAVSTRSHAVVQSGPLLNLITEKSSIRIDSTIFLPEMANIQPVIHPTRNANLFRIPFFWADDYEMTKTNPKWVFSPYENVPGLKVMMFHPIHIFLNSSSTLQYTSLRKQMDSNIEQNTYDNLNSFIWRGQGTKTFFNDFINWLSRNKESVKLKDLFNSKALAV